MLTGLNKAEVRVLKRRIYLISNDIEDRTHELLEVVTDHGVSGVDLLNALSTIEEELTKIVDRRAK